MKKYISNLKKKYINGKSDSEHKYDNVLNKNNTGYSNNHFYNNLTDDIYNKFSSDKLNDLHIDKSENEEIYPLYSIPPPTNSNSLTEKIELNSLTEKTKSNSLTEKTKSNSLNEKNKSNSLTDQFINDQTNGSYNVLNKINELSYNDYETPQVRIYEEIPYDYIPNQSINQLNQSIQQLNQMIKQSNQQSTELLNNQSNQYFAQLTNQINQLNQQLNQIKQSNNKSCDQLANDQLSDLSLNEQSTNLSSNEQPEQIIGKIVDNVKDNINLNITDDLLKNLSSEAINISNNFKSNLTKKISDHLTNCAKENISKYSTEHVIDHINNILELKKSTSIPNSLNNLPDTINNNSNSAYKRSISVGVLQNNNSILKKQEESDSAPPKRNRSVSINEDIITHDISDEKSYKPIPIKPVNNKIPNKKINDTNQLLFFSFIKKF